MVVQSFIKNNSLKKVNPQGSDEEMLDLQQLYAIEKFLGFANYDKKCTFIISGLQRAGFTGGWFNEV